MLDVICFLNADKDRCILIGRNALNYQLAQPGKNEVIFSTMDFDIVCPTFEAAEECREILESHGFVKAGATFVHERKGELDILLADISQPENVICGYYNIPSLHSLWEVRERKEGILAPPDEALIMNKLLNIRENEGKDIESVAIYFSLFPGKFAPILEKIENNIDPKERETMLFALYEAVAGNPLQKEAVEKIIVEDIGRNNQCIKKHKTCESNHEAECISNPPQRKELILNRLYGPGTLTICENKAILQLSPKLSFNVPGELLADKPYKKGDIIHIQCLRLTKDGLIIREKENTKGKDIER